MCLLVDFVWGKANKAPLFIKASNTQLDGASNAHIPSPQAQPLENSCRARFCRGLCSQSSRSRGRLYLSLVSQVCFRPCSTSCRLPPVWHLGFVHVCTYTGCHLWTFILTQNHSGITVLQDTVRVHVRGRPCYVLSLRGLVYLLGGFRGSGGFHGSESFSQLMSLPNAKAFDLNPN